MGYPVFVYNCKQYPLLFTISHIGISHSVCVCVCVCMCVVHSESAHTMGYLILFTIVNNIPHIRFSHSVCVCVCVCVYGTFRECTHYGISYIVYNCKQYPIVCVCVYGTFREYTHYGISYIVYNCKQYPIVCVCVCVCVVHSESSHTMVYSILFTIVNNIPHCLQL